MCITIKVHFEGAQSIKKKRKKSLEATGAAGSPHVNKADEVHVRLLSVYGEAKLELNLETPNHMDVFLGGGHVVKEAQI